MKEFVEKLIGRLEESRERYEDIAFMELGNSGHTFDYEFAEGKKEAIGEAIEIVNQLAEEYNNGFCEWKLDGVYLMCQHKTELFVSCLEDEKHRYKYCPICGKKIKVVD